MERVAVDIEFVGGPADGKTIAAPDGPLPETMIVPRRPVMRWVPPEPALLPQRRDDHVYVFSFAYGGTAFYDFTG